MQAFRYLALILPLWLGPACLAESVTIRVINASDGRPLQNQEVSVSLLYEKGQAAPTKYDANLALRTDAAGQVTFVVPAPAPAHISAQVRVAPSRWRCGCGVLVATQELIRDGVVGPLPAADTGKSPAPFKAAPGEILFVARPLSFWERLMYPLVKG
jgi:hypothetical protein